MDDGIPRTDRDRKCPGAHNGVLIDANSIVVGDGIPRTSFTAMRLIFGESPT